MAMSNVKVHGDKPTENYHYAGHLSLKDLSANCFGFRDGKFTALVHSHYSQGQKKML